MTEIDQAAIDSFEAEKHKKRSRANLEQSWAIYRNALKFISQMIQVPADKLNNYLRTIFFLLLLGLIFPFNLLITILTLLFSYALKFNQDKQSLPRANANPKRILVSGGMMTKALQLCRGFYHAGHRVILIDDSINWLTGHRWSNSVERFYVVPSPESEAENYIETLKNIVQKEKIDMFVPATGPYHAQLDARAGTVLAAIGCTTIHMTDDDVALVDNKFTFADKARSLGLPVPKSFLLTSRQQLIDFNFDNERRPYICKSIMYDWLDRSTMTKLPRPTREETIAYAKGIPISKECPYILQEFIQGDEYCTHGTCLDGKLTLFTCCHSSPWQLNYKHIEHPQMFDWSTKYVQALKLTGHASFDFIVSSDDGKPYGIECNPRAHSAITAFYNHPNLADAYFRPGPSTPLVPLPSARETYWVTHELWRILRNIGSWTMVLKSFRTIVNGKEAIWSWNDPLPYLLHYHVHIVYLLLENLRASRGRYFAKIDCCIGELS